VSTSKARSVLTLLFRMWGGLRSGVVRILRDIGDSDEMRFLRTYGMGGDYPEDEATVVDPNDFAKVFGMCPMCNNPLPIAWFTFLGDGGMFCCGACLFCTVPVTFIVPMAHIQDIIKRDYTADEATEVAIEFWQSMTADSEPEFGEQEDDGLSGPYL